MARRAERTGSATGRKLLALLTVIALAFWAGHDPAGAAHAARHITAGIAAFINAIHRNR